MSNLELGTTLLIAIISMAVSMAIIPLMMRFAESLGMVDKPDARKVHAVPIPRVGGVGIVIGALIPMLIWLPSTPLITSYIFGSIILFIFGVWDDVKELGHYVKFIGQFIAVIVVVYYGGLYVQHFPYVGLETIPENIGKPFTVIAIVGVINALNHSDGLDGLAGGESLLSFGAIAYLSYLYNGMSALIIACATIGGIFGFLRFNSHPARVFMGDGGSQFLGYTLGVLVVLLTQKVNPVLSPAIPLLLIGLPIVDILAVFYLRAKGRMNLFKATKNHIHHRLLELGFYHYESVILIYSIQAFFVICAIFLQYENDYLITSVYLITSALVFTTLTVLERQDFQMHQFNKDGQKDFIPGILNKSHILDMPKQIVEAAVFVFLIGSALMAVSVPVDISISALVLLFILLILILMPRFGHMLLFRLIVFISIGFAVYLSTSYPPEWLVEQYYLVWIYFLLLTIASFAMVRMTTDANFRITPLDYLVIIIALIITIIPESEDADSKLTWMVLQMIVLFYASELILQRLNMVRNRFSGAIITMLTLVALRGLL